MNSDMKTTYKKLLEDIFAAYFDARKHKRNTNNQLRFEMQMEEKLVELARDIYERRYEPSRSVCFIVEHPVKREIFAADFRDRVVHHLLFNYISPLFERHLIPDCYSCRKGFGTLYGIERLEHHIRSCTRNFTREAYVLKLDIAGYFMSINKDTLFSVIKPRLEGFGRDRRLKDTFDLDMVLYITRKIIFDNPTVDCIYKTHPRTWEGLPSKKSLFGRADNVGLPIGNLTSQLFSNIYLTPFDNYVKRTLNVKHYGRYVDDFYLVDTDKHFLLQCIKSISEYLQENLQLELHPNKIYLQNVNKGVNFLGAHVKPHRRYTIKRTTTDIRRSMNRMNGVCEKPNPTQDELRTARSVVNSYLGYLQHFDSHKMKHRIADKSHGLKKYGQFGKNVCKYKLDPSSIIKNPFNPAVADPAAGF